MINLFTGIVCTVVVYKYDLLGAVLQCSQSQTLEHIVDVLVAVICADNY